MLTKNKTGDSVFTESSVRESADWNRITTIIATVVVLFFFTRSAPFPASTFWELTIARDFDTSFTGFIFPETLSLLIADSSVSLLGLKAIYHVLYFILCSSLCFWIFKNQEPMPGLVGLALFTFTMQSYLNLRMLLTLIFILGIVFLMDKNLVKGRLGLIFLPIMAAVSGLGLNTPLILLLIIIQVCCNENYGLSIILFSIIGGLIFPEGFVAVLDRDLVFNWNFMPVADMQILYLLSGIFLLANLIFMGKLTRNDLPNMIFYVISGLFSLISPAAICVFVLIGLIMQIKLLSEQRPMPLNMQLIGLLLITTMVYLYLFINPFGIKLNPSVKGQLGKDLAPLMEGYIDHMPIERHNLGELAWKGMIRYDQGKIREMHQKDELILVRTSSDEFKVVQRKQQNKAEKVEKDFEF